MDVLNITNNVFVIKRCVLAQVFVFAGGRKLDSYQLKTLCDPTTNHKYHKDNTRDARSFFILGQLGGCVVARQGIHNHTTLPKPKRANMYILAFLR